MLNWKPNDPLKVVQESPRLAKENGGKTMKTQSSIRLPDMGLILAEHGVRRPMFRQTWPCLGTVISWVFQGHLSPILFHFPCLVLSVCALQFRAIVAPSNGPIRKKLTMVLQGRTLSLRLRIYWVLLYTHLDLIPGLQNGVIRVV